MASLPRKGRWKVCVDPIFVGSHWVCCCWFDCTIIIVLFGEQTPPQPFTQGTIEIYAHFPPYDELETS
uniref:Putative ovule protein n=1 Tax=Solanum chacoense TaxID=4108 RepID=A0A0V0GLG6_SOLCH